MLLNDEIKIGNICVIDYESESMDTVTRVVRLLDNESTERDTIYAECINSSMIKEYPIKDLSEIRRAMGRLNYLRFKSTSKDNLICNDRFKKERQYLEDTKKIYDKYLINIEFNNEERNILSSIVYGNGIYVATGNNGDILTSRDGSNWTYRPNDCYRHIYKVIYSNDIFVAVGMGVILTSSDGINWTERYDGDITLRDVLYGIDHYIAVGYDGTILTSPDGFRWNQRPSGTYEALERIIYGDGLYVVAGHGVVLTSIDGINWDNKCNGINYYNSLSCITYGNGLFVAASLEGTILTSSVGDIWTVRFFWNNGGIYDIIYKNDMFVAVGLGGVILTSKDGIKWNVTCSFNKISDTLFKVIYANGLFVAVGRNGVIATSPDGSVWTERDKVTNNHLYNIIYENGMYLVAGGGSDILKSTDGIEWVNQTDEVKCRAIC